MESTNRLGTSDLATIAVGAAATVRGHDLNPWPPDLVQQQMDAMWALYDNDFHPCGVCGTWLPREDLRSVDGWSSSAREYVPMFVCKEGCGT